MAFEDCRPCVVRILQKLVGKWRVSGEADGEISYAWMDGGFFLIARGDTTQGEQNTKHVEIIGYDHEAGGEPSKVMTPLSRRAGGRSIRVRACPSVVFPEPDSPTSPTNSPCSSARLTSRTDQIRWPRLGS